MRTALAPMCNPKQDKEPRKRNKLDTPARPIPTQDNPHQLVLPAPFPKHTLLTLPSELRNHIYRNLLANRVLHIYSLHSTYILQTTLLPNQGSLRVCDCNIPILADNHTVDLHPSYSHYRRHPDGKPDLRVLRTCKQINQEATVIFWGDNTFRFATHMPLLNFVDSLWGESRPGTLLVGLEMLRRVSMDMAVYAKPARLLDLVEKLPKACPNLERIDLRLLPTNVMPHTGVPATADFRGVDFDAAEMGLLMMLKGLKLRSLKVEMIVEVRERFPTEMERLEEALREGMQLVGGRLEVDEIRLRDV